MAKTTRILFGFSVLAAASYALTRALAITLFLARVGPVALPGALAIAAVTAIGVSLATRRLMQRRSTASCATVSWLLLAAATGVLALTIGPYHHSIWVLGGLYVLAEVRGYVGTIYAVSLSSEAFAGAGSKHPFAVVSSGAPIAGTVVGLVLGFEASIAQAASILIVIAALDVATAALTWWSRPRLARAKASTAESRDRVEPIVPKRSFEAYRFSLSGLVALQIVALTLIGFQWKVTVADHYGPDEVSLVSYFAFFYAFSDILVVLIQWLASGRLLDRFGLGLGLRGLPVMCALVGVAVFLSPTEMAMLIVLTVANGLNVLRRSIHDPALTAAYSALHPHVRRETILTVKGVIKPVAEAATGMALLLSGVALLGSGLTVAWIGVVALWFCFAVRVSRTYRSAARPA